MYDNRTRRRLNHANLEQDGRSVRSDEHGETVVQFKHADRVGKGVADVLVADSVLAGAGRDSRLNTQDDKLACDRRCCNQSPCRKGATLDGW